MGALAQEGAIRHQLEPVSNVGSGPFASDDAFWPHEPRACRPARFMWKEYVMNGIMQV